MKLSLNLQKKVIEFLLSLPNISDSDSQKALIYQAGLDSELQAQILFGRSTAQFVPLLVLTLSKYGKLKDGRYALEAILVAAKSSVGEDRKIYCDTLLHDIRKQRGNQALLGSKVIKFSKRWFVEFIVVIFAISVIMTVIENSIDPLFKFIQILLTGGIVFIGGYIFCFFKGVEVFFHYYELEHDLLIDITNWGGYEYYKKIYLLFWGKIVKLAYFNEWLYTYVKLFIAWYKEGNELWRSLSPNISSPTRYFPLIDLSDIDAIYELGKRAHEESKYSLAIVAYNKVVHLIEKPNDSYRPELAQVFADRAALIRLIENEPGFKKPFWLRLHVYASEEENRANRILNRASDFSRPQKLYCKLVDNEITIEMDLVGEVIEAECTYKRPTLCQKKISLLGGWGLIRGLISDYARLEDNIKCDLCM